MIDKGLLKSPHLSLNPTVFGYATPHITLLLSTTRYCLYIIENLIYLDARDDGMEDYMEMNTNIAFTDQVASICYVKMHGVWTDYTYTTAQSDGLRSCFTPSLSTLGLGENSYSSSRIGISFVTR